MITQEMVLLLMSELKRQHEWRLEDCECGIDEINESWDVLKFRIAQSFKELGCTEDVYNMILRES